jgi:hypothetical protein
MQDDKDQGPLRAEALARDEWRRGAAELKPGDAPGHTLPESESGEAGEGGETRRPDPIAGTMLPSD